MIYCHLVTRELRVSVLSYIDRKIYKIISLLEAEVIMSIGFGYNNVHKDTFNQKGPLIYPLIIKNPLGLATDS